MGWIDPSVIIFDHFALYESKFLCVKLHGIVVRDLDVQGNLCDIAELRAIFMLFKVVQNRFDQLCTDCSTPVCRQDPQCHDVDPLFVAVAVVIVAAVFAVAIVVFVDGFYPCARGTYNKSVPIGKFAQAIAFAFRDVFIVFFLVLDRKTCQIYLSQLEYQCDK